MKMTLQNLKIVVPETRLLEVLANAMEKRGATVLRCPLISIYDSPQHLDVINWVKKLDAGQFDLTLWYTGEGLRRIQNILANHAPELHSKLPAILNKTKHLVRGPKPTKELKKLGIEPDIVAAEPTTAGIMQTLEKMDLTGQSIGLQLYGEYSNPPLQEFLAPRCKTITPVAPYIYADESETEQVAALIEQLCNNQLQAMCFTSASQVTRLYSVAKKHDKQSALTSALDNMLIIAVGPVVKDALLDKQISVDVMPKDSFFIKPMIRALEQKLREQ